MESFAALCNRVRIPREQPKDNATHTCKQINRQTLTPVYCHIDASDDDDTLALVGHIAQSFRLKRPSFVDEIFTKKDNREGQKLYRLVVDIEWDPVKDAAVPPPPPIEHIVRYVDFKRYFNGILTVNIIRHMVRFIHENTLPRPSDYDYLGLKSIGEEEDEDAPSVAPTFVLESKPDADYMHRRNLPVEDKYSYHVALPLELPGRSGLHDEALELMFPNKHPFRPYIDFKVYQAQTHNLRAPMCDKINDNAGFGEGRPFKLHSVWYWDAKQGAPLRHPTGEEVLKHSILDNKEELLYYYSCMRVMRLNPNTNEPRRKTQIKGLLKDCGITAKYNRARALRISQRRDGDNGMGRIELEDHEYRQFETLEIDKIAALPGVSIEDKKRQIVRYINRFFGVVAGQDAKNIIQKFWDDVSRNFTIKYCTFETVSGVYCHCRMGIPKQGRRREQEGEQGEAESEVEEVEVFKMWKFHPDKRVYQGVVFNAWPGTYDKETNPHAPMKDAFNLFQKDNLLSLEEMRARYNNCLYRADVISWFVQVILCKYDYHAYDTLTRLLLTKILRPERKPAQSLMLKGAQGTGKSLFLEAVARLFGRHALITYRDDDFTGKFNSMLEGVIFVYCNESERKNSKGNTGVSKALKSQNYLVVEHKGKDSYKAHNYILLASDSNHRHALNLDLDSRREFVLEVLDSMVGFKPFYTELARQLETYKQGRTYLAAWLYEEYLRIGGEKGLDEFEAGHNWGENRMTTFTIEQRLLSTTGPQGVFLEWVKRGFAVHPQKMRFYLPYPNAKITKGKSYMIDPRFIPEPEKHPFWVKAITFDDLYDEYVSTVSTSVGTENGHAGRQQHTKNLFKAELAAFFNIRSKEREYVWDWGKDDKPEARNEELFMTPREIGKDAKKHRKLVIFFQLSLSDQRAELRIKKRGLPFDVGQSTNPEEGDISRGQKRRREEEEEEEEEGDQQHDDEEQQRRDLRGLDELLADVAGPSKKARTEAWERRMEEQEGFAGNPLLAGFDVKIRTHFPRLDDEELMPPNGPWLQDESGKPVKFDPFWLGFQGYEAAHPSTDLSVEERYKAYKEARGLGEPAEDRPVPAPEVPRPVRMEEGELVEDD